MAKTLLKADESKRLKKFRTAFLLIHVLKEKAVFTHEDVMKLLKCSKRQADIYISILESKGFIHRVRRSPIMYRILRTPLTLDELLLGNIQQTKVEIKDKREYILGGLIANMKETVKILEEYLESREWKKLKKTLKQLDKTMTQIREIIDRRKKIE